MKRQGLHIGLFVVVDCDGLVGCYEIVERLLMEGRRRREKGCLIPRGAVDVVWREAVGSVGGMRKELT